jgi:spoIIIJ-associated protein
MTDANIQGEGATLAEALAEAVKNLGVSTPDEMEWDYQREHFRGGAWSVIVTAKPLDPAIIAQRKADDAMLGDAKGWLRALMNWFHNAPGLQIVRRGEAVILNLTDAEDARLFIGREGKNIPAFQHLFAKVMSKTQTEGKILLDFDGYMGDRESGLDDEIAEAIQSVLDTGEPVTMRKMNGYERHLVHSMVKDTDGVVSSSEGEGSIKSGTISPSDASQDG